MFSIFGEERPGQAVVADDPHDQLPFLGLLREMWADRRTRLFFLFLALGALSASAQDAVLEPFGGEVLGLDVGDTTRFNTYWGGGALITLLGTVVATRRRLAHDQSGTTILGLVLTALPLVLLAVVALTAARTLINPVLVLFGLGYGIYTVGAISLLMAMTSDRRAGAYLGFWSVAQLVFRGVGIFLGGVVRDLLLLASGSASLAYASVFLLEAVGLLACVALVIKVDVPGFARSAGARAAPAASLAATADV